MWSLACSSRIVWFSLGSFVSSHCIKTYWHWCTDICVSQLEWIRPPLCQVFLVIWLCCHSNAWLIWPLQSRTFMPLMCAVGCCYSCQNKKIMISDFTSLPGGTSWLLNRMVSSNQAKNSPTNPFFIMSILYPVSSLASYTVWHQLGGFPSSVEFVEVWSVAYLLIYVLECDESLLWNVCLEVEGL